MTLPRPRGIARVYAMARPRRPDAEGAAVRLAAAAASGSCAQRARRIANAVVRRAMVDLDGDAADRVLLLLATIEPTPVDLLATDPEIDTVALIRSERAARLEARGWRRPTAQEWDADDREVVRLASERLARRYARHLARFHP